VLANHSPNTQPVRKTVNAYNDQQPPKPISFNSSLKSSNPKILLFVSLFLKKKRKNSNHLNHSIYPNHTWELVRRVLGSEHILRNPYPHLTQSIQGCKTLTINDPLDRWDSSTISLLLSLPSSVKNLQPLTILLRITYNN